MLIFPNYTIVYLLCSNMVTNRAGSAPMDVDGRKPAGAAPGPICSPVTMCLGGIKELRFVEDARKKMLEQDKT